MKNSNVFDFSDFKTRYFINDPHNRRSVNVRTQHGDCVHISITFVFTDRLTKRPMRFTVVKYTIGVYVGAYREEGLKCQNSPRNVFLHYIF